MQMPEYNAAKIMFLSGIKVLLKKKMFLCFDQNLSIRIKIFYSGDNYIRIAVIIDITLIITVHQLFAC